MIVLIAKSQIKSLMKPNFIRVLYTLLKRSLRGRFAFSLEESRNTIKKIKIYTKIKKKKVVPLIEKLSCPSVSITFWGIYKLIVSGST